ncbi:MAG: hypothetical protein Q4G08_10605 [Capnocytophaga sp.]|nr:hypothetical protein [Capnocytophaga sp.]
MNPPRLTSYIEALRLDNIVLILTDGERYQSMAYRLGFSHYIPPRVQQLQDWIEANRYEVPEIKYNEDRNLLYFDDDKLVWRDVRKHELFNFKII